MSFHGVEYQARAKINLSLSVGEINDDGMHPIVSKIACVDFSDDLEVVKLDEATLSRYAILWADDAPQKSPINWPITRDLAVRAHRLLEHASGHPLPVQMKLQKRIPIGGGLGGGSSDAAAMLLACSELYNLDVDLVSIAGKLGSDVPFFLTGGTAVVSGFGETIEPLGDEKLHLVLMAPEYGCPTGEVYDSFDDLGIIHLDEKRVRGGELFNDLFDAACKISEELHEDFNRLQQVTGLEIHLSGSGSTMFTICDNEQHALTLAKEVTEKSTINAIATYTCLPNMAMERNQ